MSALTPHENNALTAPRGMGFDLSPQNFEQAQTFAKYLAESDMVPKAFQGKPGNCLVAMQWGYELNIKPLQALQGIAVINGKPSIYGDLGKAILLANGCIIDEDDMAVVKASGRARCKITRPGRPPVERTFSRDDAQTAGLLNKDGPWKLYPSRQMAWRAFWFAARDIAADLLRGMGGAEESGDMVHNKDMGPADVVKPETTPYPADLFATNLPKWREVIEGGRKTADTIISFAETRNPNTPFTDEQKATLRAFVPVKNATATDVQPKGEGPAPLATATSANDGPAITFAHVNTDLNAAKDMDALDLAASLIGEVPDEQHRAELTAVYNTRAAALNPQ